MNVTRKARPFDKDDFPAGSEACCLTGLAFLGAGAATALGFLGLTGVGAVKIKEAGGGGGVFSVMEAGGGGGALTKPKVAALFFLCAAWGAAWGAGLILIGGGGVAAMTGLGGIALGGGATLGLLGAETKPELGLLSFILPPALGT